MNLSRSHLVSESLTKLNICILFAFANAFNSINVFIVAMVAPG